MCRLGSCDQRLQPVASYHGREALLDSEKRGRHDRVEQSGLLKSEACRGHLLLGRLEVEEAKSWHRNCCDQGIRQSLLDVAATLLSGMGEGERPEKQSPKET